MQPKIIIHGGAGSSLQDKGGLIAVRQSLHDIIKQLYPLLLAGESAKAVVVKGCQLLEDEPRFNAGTGSVLQSDGQIRMSASLMDGTKQSFSGVINVSRVKNPINMALFLQDSDDRVLSDVGSAELARELQIPIFNPLTDKRLNEWVDERQGNFSRSMANVVAESSSAGRGTIGVVVLDSQGQLAVGTSTGGKGFERIGRVSDSATPAGNYANSQAAVSCTGIGEDILDESLASKIVIRVTDGASLQQALQRSFAEAEKNKRDFGAIAIAVDGAIGWGKTCDVILSAFHDGNQIGDSLEAVAGTQTFVV
ncbi:MAG: isoaspartyl peptidase/L-asparaginase [Microcoleaceae cyanobacterium]